MNRKQKLCLLLGIAAIVVMGLFPPWVIQTREITRLNNRWEVKFTLEPGPYSWIGEPPSNDAISWFWPPPAYIPEGAIAKFIDLYRLGLQCFIVAVVTAGLIIIFGDKKVKKLPG